MSKPTVLMILDGWGVNKPYTGNAVHHANTPYFDYLISNYRTTVLKASESSVGLPTGVFGNSEVGHTTLGAGRVFYQDLLRIDQAIANGDFFNNPSFQRVLDHVIKNNSQLHLMGLVSDGCVHSSNQHLFALLELAKRHNLQQVFVHVFLDGRDTPYNSGINYVTELEAKLKEIGVGQIATVSGRFWAMDRDTNWHRVAKTCQALTLGAGSDFDSASAGLLANYDNGIYDEEIQPFIIHDAEDKPLTTITAGDGVVFFNYRSDRARELTAAFVDDTLSPDIIETLGRETLIKDLYFVTFTQYKAGLATDVAFPPIPPVDTLGQVISAAQLKQLRIAETEKYAHVTYFFNGGEEQPFPGEDRILVPSPKVESYAERPAMSALEVTDKLLTAIKSNQYDFILVNYANADMVGHTGNIEAAISAIETVDSCLEKICSAVLAQGGELLVTADHGNADEMLDDGGQIVKEHSMNLVPLIFVGERFKLETAGSVDLHQLTASGGLADVAPTILAMLKLKQPAVMTGKSLLS